MDISNYLKAPYGTFHFNLGTGVDNQDFSMASWLNWSSTEKHFSAAIV
jgi:hypothetical protein